MLRRITRVTVASSFIAGAALIATSAGLSARGQDFVTCDDGSSYAITTTTQPTDHSVGWGVGRIEGGDHLIPTSFSGTAYDTEIGQTLFSFGQAKGSGNGQHNQTLLTCTTPTEPTTVGEFLDGEPMPQEWADLGAQLSDPLEVTFTVTAVHRP